MVHEVELSSIPILDISVGVTVNGQNLHLLVFKDEEFRLYTQNSNENRVILVHRKANSQLHYFLLIPTWSVNTFRAT